MDIGRQISRGTNDIALIQVNDSLSIPHIRYQDLIPTDPDLDPSSTLRVPGILRVGALPSGRGPCRATP